MLPCTGSPAFYQNVAAVFAGGVGMRDFCAAHGWHTLGKCSHENLIRLPLFSERHDQRKSPPPLMRTSANPKSKLEETMRLRRNQLCPIHRSQFCCGREAIPRERRQRQLGVRRIDDPQHPRGYREIRSNAEMRKLMDRKIARAKGDLRPLQGTVHRLRRHRTGPDQPPGYGGAWRDDHPENIQAVHWWCNGEKGSSRG